MKHSKFLALIMALTMAIAMAVPTFATAYEPDISTPYYSVEKAIYNLNSTVGDMIGKAGETFSKITNIPVDTETYSNGITIVTPSR